MPKAVVSARIQSKKVPENLGASTYEPDFPYQVAVTARQRRWASDSGSDSPVSCFGSRLAGGARTQFGGVDALAGG